jgi:hypothetical protein
VRSKLRVMLEAATEAGRGQSTAWDANQRMIGRRGGGRTHTPVARSQKHGSKAGRRKGGSRGGRHS